MTINEYYDRVFIINLDRRTDRWDNSVSQCNKHGIKYERFPALEVLVDGKPHGNSGCTASHKALLERLALSDWERILILEDDVDFFDGTQEKFATQILEVPDDCDILFIGGSYGSKPQYRVSEHVIRTDRMQGTHCYGVSKKFAVEMSDKCQNGPIDALYSCWCQERKYYSFQPRLAGQIKGFSDIQGKETDYRWIYVDKRHEEMV